MMGTPISSESGSATGAMPVFYGMMLAEQFAGATFVQSNLRANTNAAAYAATAAGGYRVAVFNKDENQGLSLVVRLSGSVKNATAWRLEARTLDATEGVTLAGASVEPHAVWAPKAVEHLGVKDGVVHLAVPAASAALLFIK